MKVAGYRVWFGAILFLEFSLLTKAETLLRAYKSRGVAKLNFLKHKWVSFGTHVIIDAAVLWFLNAFPGVPNTGLARQSEKDAKRERRRRATSRVGSASNAARTSRRLLVPQHVP